MAAAYAPHPVMIAAPPSAASFGYGGAPGQMVYAGGGAGQGYQQVYGRYVCNTVIISYHIIKLYNTHSYRIIYIH